MTELHSGKKPDRVHYGFLRSDGTGLLHVGVNPVRGGHELIHWEQTVLDNCTWALAEWTTNSLLDILYMYLMPSEYTEATNDGKDRKHPRPTHQDARPIAIYTKDLLGIRQREFSAPLVIPTLLKEDGMRVQCTRVGVEDRRHICSVFRAGGLTVGELYYSLGDLIKPLVYECIAPMGWEYLMLEVPEGELLSRVIPSSTPDTIII